MFPNVMSGRSTLGMLLLLLLLTAHMVEVVGFLLYSSTDYSEAKAEYDVELLEEDFMVTLQRSIAFMAVGETRLAIKEVTSVLQQRPNFQPALLQRGAFYIQIGKYDLARNDLDNVLHIDAHNAEALASQRRISTAQDQWKTAEDMAAMGDHATAIPLLSTLLHVSPWSVPYRQLRANAYIAVHDLELAVVDMRIVNRLTRDETDGYHRLASVLLRQGDITGAIDELRTCLRLDPDQVICFHIYKILRQLEKSLTAAEEALKLGKYEKCINESRTAQCLIRTEPLVTFEALRIRCSCYKANSRYAMALLPCTAALEIKLDSRVLCDIGGVFVGLEMYDKALQTYEQALEMDMTAQCAKRGIGVASRSLKKAEQKDYYDILGVKRSANTKEIHRAYRRAAQKWHPDNFLSEEKKFAESKFLQIAAAKEVLLDPEKRRMFDRGVDPLHPRGKWRY